ncbi:response regulator [Paenibacillus sp. FSL E2-0178]|uniref:response regulator transcription factor n=1 Tax=Paenibacillus sp. FSL E2-0178 TaxID=2921361 RepID=UPI003158A757
MYKAIIADDEAVFRKYLMGAIDWGTHGIRVCGEAKNGVEALELIERESPDFALIDINMPYMNGIELATAIKEKHPSTIVLFVTGHSEFEYARQAIKIGVSDYILKPFDEEELLAAVIKMKSEADKSRLEQDQNRKERSIWRESLLNQLISKGVGNEDKKMLNHLSILDIQDLNSAFQVVAVEMDDQYQDFADADEISLRKLIISNILNDLKTSEENYYIFEGPENRVVTILELAGSDDPGRLEEYFSRLCQLIKRHFGFSVKVGIGRPGRGISSIHQSYMESVIVLSNKISMEQRDVVFYEQIALRFGNIGFYPSEMNEKLLVYLRLHDQDEIFKSLSAIQQFIRSHQLTSDYIHMILAGLVSLCLTYIYEIGKTVEEIFPDGFSPFQEITRKPSLEAAFEWIRELYQMTIEKSENMKHSKSGKLLETARDYIHAHFQDSQLKVEEVSKQLYVQSRYLRKIFNQELGMGVSEYITEFRMQKAKELLVSGQNLRLADISQMVGYSDPGHFSKSFKKNTGFSPSEYEVIKRK